MSEERRKIFFSFRLEFASTKMKLTFALLFLISIQLERIHPISQVGIAIGKVIESYFAKHHLNFDIVVCAKSSELENLVESALKTSVIVAAPKVVKLKA